MIIPAAAETATGQEMKPLSMFLVIRRIPCFGISDVSFCVLDGYLIDILTGKLYRFVCIKVNE